MPNANCRNSAPWRWTSALAGPETVADPRNGRLLSQQLMNKRDRDRPFTDRRGDAFDIASANIPGSKNSGPAGFEQIGSASERPARAGQFLRGKIGTCFNEAFVVEHDATFEPAGVGVRSCHYEHVGDVLFLGFAGFAIAPRDPFEMVDTYEADDFRVYEQADVRRLFNPTNEILRHCFSETRTSDEHIHVLCALGQKYSSLARGISTADHNDFFAAVQNCGSWVRNRGSVCCF